MACALPICQGWVKRSVTIVILSHYGPGTAFAQPTVSQYYRDIQTAS
jgi:hypothetical protein